MELDAVVIWGWPLDSHTHSYIHQAFYKTFSYLGYKCYWIDHKKPFHEYNLTLPDKCLFITEGQVDKDIVMNPKSYYLLHNCEMQKYEDAGIPAKHKLILQVYTKPCVPRGPPLNDSEFIRLADGVLYMPWATDLLPHEIDVNIANVEKISKEYKPVSHFIGFYLHDPWQIYFDECARNNIQVSYVGGYFDFKVSIEENMRRIQESIVAPAFQQPWQIDNGYIPCRIFKNISYGKMGVTNCDTVQKLFNGKLIYDRDVKVATQKAIDYVKKGEDLELLKSLMIEVRDKHTYINRIKDIFEAFSKL